VRPLACAAFLGSSRLSEDERAATDYPGVIWRMRPRVSNVSPGGRTSPQASLCGAALFEMIICASIHGDGPDSRACPSPPSLVDDSRFRKRIAAWLPRSAPKDLRAALDAGVIDAPTYRRLVDFLAAPRSEAPSRFDFVNLLWYLGALIVLGAMGLFSTNAFGLGAPRRCSPHHRLRAISFSLAPICGNGAVCARRGAIDRLRGGHDAAVCLCGSVDDGPRSD